MLRRGFTLIELLIVVAILALLAAIAIVNMLEAQVRCKVARTKADLKTLATALEAYRVDANAYPPNDGNYNVEPIQLSTPVAYITSGMLMDPFKVADTHAFRGDLVKFYTYTKVVSYAEFIFDAAHGYPPPNEGVDAEGYNPGALEKYGAWRLVGWGPDRLYNIPGTVFTDPVVQGSDTAYDPTNGTTSAGNVRRWQKRTE